MGPGSAILASFGAAAVPVLLPGGEGTTWRAGDIVLKPAGDPRAARWTAEVYRILGGRSGPDFRVPEPVRAVWPGGGGDWVAGDPDSGAWAAWRWLPGQPADWSGCSPRWPRLLAVSRAFHAALAGLPAPDWLGTDGSPWTLADQMAWGERDPQDILELAPPGLAGQIRRLLAALRPIGLPAQLVHGDLTGNVLFAGAEPPAVIDFSPYWRPAALAVAVAAVDALTWYGADPAILDELAGEPETGQLLARAHAGRLLTEVLIRGPRGGVAGNQAALDTVERTARPVTGLILGRLALVLSPVRKPREAERRV